MYPRALRKQGADGKFRAQRYQGKAQKVCGPCCGGGGGGGDCCVCGLCFFDPDAPGWDENGQAHISEVVTLTGGGNEVGCCQSLGPNRGGCSLSELIVPHETLVYDHLLRSGGCGVDYRTHNIKDITAVSCDFDEETGPFDYQVLTRFTAKSGAVCPKFRMPSQGAVFERGASNDQGAVVTIWGGTPCFGPLLYHQTRHAVLAYPAPFTADGPDVLNMFVVTGVGGGAAFIATLSLQCRRDLCDGGCAVDEEDYPHRISGGGSISGGMDCDGAFGVEVTLQADAEIACDLEFSAGCSSFSRCAESGPFSASFSYSASTNFGGLLGQCPPGPERGSGGGLEGGDPDDPADQIIVPPEWLADFPELKAAVDAIRASLGPGTDQVPPPIPVGGMNPDPNQRAIEGLLDRDPMRKCRGCGK